VREEPALLATTAHIGMGVVDVRSSVFDAEREVLQVGLVPAGRARRRVFVACGGRTPVSASLDGDPIEMQGAGDVRYIDITVAAEAVLEVSFG
jgi:hypothetical protein